MSTAATPSSRLSSIARSASVGRDALVEARVVDAAGAELVADDAGVDAGPAESPAAICRSDLGRAAAGLVAGLAGEHGDVDRARRSCSRDALARASRSSSALIAFSASGST